MKASITVDLVGNVIARSQQFSGAMKKLGNDSEKSLGMAGRTATLAARGIDRLGNRYTALVTGGTLTMAARQVGDLEERLTRLGIAAEISDKEIADLKKQIYDTSLNKDVLIDPAELISAIEEISTKTGDLQFARDNLMNLAMAIQATGAEGQAIGGLVAEFKKLGVTDFADVLEALDTLNLQGKNGAFELGDLARLGPRVVSAYAGLGRTGVPALREMGAALQVIRQGTGSSEQAATAFEATLATLTDPEKIKQLKELGNIDVYTLKDGVKQFKSIDVLMTEIIKASSGDVTKLGMVFDVQAMRAFTTAAAEYQKTGQVETLQKLVAIVGDGNQTLQDSARAAGTFNAAWGSMTTSAKIFADSNLTEPLQDLADWLRQLKPEQVQRFFDTAKQGAIAFGAVWAGLKIVQGAKAISDTFRYIRGSNSKTASSSGLAGSMTPVPVYVVNNPGLGVDAATNGKKAGKAGKAGAAARYGRAALGFGTALATSSTAMVLGAGAAGYGVGTLISNQIEGTAASDKIGHGIATLLAALGNKEARDAIAARKQAEAFLQVEVTDTRVNVSRVDSTNTDVEVSTGRRRRIR